MTAKEAREITEQNETVQKFLKLAEEEIVKAAKEGKSSTIFTPEDGYQHSVAEALEKKEFDAWVVQSHIMGTPDWVKITW